MTRFTLTPRLRLAVLLLALLTPISLHRLEAREPRCGLDDPITLVSEDSRDGSVLLALPALGGDSTLIEWSAENGARQIEDATPGQRFGGSFGPGPFFVLLRCGDSCLQPMVRREGRWAPLGEPLPWPRLATTEATYDRSGAPWLVFRTPRSDSKDSEAWAFRLEGADWRPVGTLGLPNGTGGDVAPVLDDANAVVAGLARFDAEEGASLWLSTLPVLEDDEGKAALSRLRALNNQSAALWTGDGLFFHTENRGETWKRSTWSPWPELQADIWVRGRDFELDAAYGTEDALPVLWFDRRVSEQGKLRLTRMDATGKWTEIAQLAESLAVSGGSTSLTPLHVLVDAEGDWSLLYGCARRAGQPVLVLRRVVGGEVGDPQLVEIAGLP